ncbi:MAG: alkaline phosphatase D family protein [Porticoccaceae bacterium]
MPANRLAGSLFAVFIAVANGYAHPDESMPITHGVAAGDVTDTSALIWARTDRRGYLHVLLRSGDGIPRQASTPVDAIADYTGKLTFDHLKSAQGYHYEVWFSPDKLAAGEPEQTAKGFFRTAPTPARTAAVSFAWGGDVAGQNVCRDQAEGFPIFNAINAMRLDFFVGLGDMIYADGVCNATGLYGNAQVPGDFAQSAALGAFWAHWKYNREDASYQRLLASTAYFPIWDDHEVANDFDPLHDTRDTAPYKPGQHLLPIGLRAFLDYNPVSESELTPSRLYRAVRWGRHLELLMLDNRQYRDANRSKDNLGTPKTMLGREQLAWLKHRLKQGGATWKIIVTSVPLSIPTGSAATSGRDGWANYDHDTGFERELLDLFKFMQEQHVHNVLFITTDVHFAEVFRYTPFPEHADFQVHEYATGPLNAGLFPNRNFDTSLGTQSLFFYGPEPAPTRYEDARRWMNFGAVHIDASGLLTATVRDVDGKVLHEARHTPR